jgi:hypothetical protein
MELNYWEKQLILYVKGHFKRVDYDKDLNHFPANLYGLELEQVEQYSVFGMVVGVYQSLVDDGRIKFTLETFISDVFKRSLFEREKKNQINYDDILRQMLGEIQSIKVLGENLELGSPDTNLFKKIQEEINEEKIKKMETYRNKSYLDN